MVIGGLQKLTLLDYPGKVACTVFLPGCNLRCPYCHNSSLVIPERISGGIPEEELMAFLRKRQGKLDGVCITGGEPTIHRELPNLIGRIRDLGYLVKLDTNGSNPKMLESLISEGLLDYVAMDIKNSPEAYAKTCGGISILETASRSMELLKQNRIDYEFRTTVCKPFHTEESMRELARWIQGAKRYFIQNFEDSGDLIGSGMGPFTDQELEALLNTVREFVPEAHIRGRD